MTNQKVELVGEESIDGQISQEWGLMKAMAAASNAGEQDVVNDLIRQVDIAKYPRLFDMAIAAAFSQSLRNVSANLDVARKLLAVTAESLTDFRSAVRFGYLESIVADIDDVAMPLFAHVAARRVAHGLCNNPSMLNVVIAPPECIEVAIKRTNEIRLLTPFEATQSRGQWFSHNHPADKFNVCFIPVDAECEARIKEVCTRRTVSLVCCEDQLTPSLRETILSAMNTAGCAVHIKNRAGQLVEQHHNTSMLAKAH